MASVGLRESGKGTENTFMLELRPILVLYHHPFGLFLACCSNSGYSYIFFTFASPSFSHSHPHSFS